LVGVGGIQGLVCCGGDAFELAPLDAAAADVATDVAGDDATADIDASSSDGPQSDGARADASSDSATSADVVRDVVSELYCPIFSPSACGTGTLRPDLDLCVCRQSGCETVTLMQICACWTCACVAAQGNWCELAFGLHTAQCTDTGSGPRYTCQ
ncbi:MAG: hypothetical protein ACHREM_24440, partial [Polyangiales bacterium]